MTAKMNERMAIIRNPHIQRNDHTLVPCIVISCYVEESIAADHWIAPGDAAFSSLWDKMNGDVKNLDGKPCLVLEESSIGGIQRFLRMLDI